MTRILEQPNLEGQEPDYKRFPITGLKVEWCCPCGHTFEHISGEGDHLLYPTFGKETKLRAGCEVCGEELELDVIVHCQLRLEPAQAPMPANARALSEVELTRRECDLLVRIWGAGTLRPGQMKGQRETLKGLVQKHLAQMLVHVPEDDWPCVTFAVTSLGADVAAEINTVVN